MTDAAANPTVNEPSEQAREPQAITDAQWAFDHVSDDSVTQADAPSVGAWGLMTQARESPVIYKELLARVMPIGSDAGGPAMPLELLMQLERQVAEGWGMMAKCLMDPEHKCQHCGKDVSRPAGYEDAA